jgi:hypothetical protein
MPIIGLSDRGLAFPEIGQIRKGAKKTAKRPGKDLQWFRVEFDEQEQDTATNFNQRYGDKPNEINIILPFDEIERCWDAWLEAYTAGRMVARSDGERFTYLLDTESGEILIKNGEPFKKYKEGEPVGKDYQGKPVYCRPVGRLKVIVPELARAAYLTVMTTSVHDIANLSAQLEAFKQINSGIIKGIPLVLRRRPKKISVPKPKSKNQRVRMEKWLLSIEADPAWVKAKLTEVKYLSLPGNGFPLLPESEEEIEAEFVEAPEWEFEEGDELPIEMENGKMSLETAEDVTNSEGVRYGDIDSDTLSHMSGSLIKSLRNKDMNFEDREEHQYKLDAIKVILADRNGE